MSVIVVGLNHRTAPLELLERVTVPAARLPKALADLRARAALDEVVVLSTCMRTEVYATAERFHPAVQDIRNFLCELSFSAPEDVADHLTMLYDDAAIGHLFSVASGLDSAVLGESEVLAQVRGAWDVGPGRGRGRAGPVRPVPPRASRSASGSARRPAIARGTTSVSQAAVQLAAHHLGGPLQGRRILVLGAGDMGEGMAVALAGAGVGRRPGRQPHAGPRPQALAAARRRPRRRHRRPGRRRSREVDVLLTSTGAPEPLLDRRRPRPRAAPRRTARC